MARRPGKQHLPKRDEQRTREIADLKRQNHQLKRDLARMRKVTDREVEREDPSPREKMPKALKSESEVQCPLCQSKDTTFFEAPSGKRLYGCRSCQKWRGDSVSN